MAKYLGPAFLVDVRNVVLTGLSVTTNAVITAADSIASALGKLQAQITAETSRATAAEALLAPKANPVFLGGILNTSPNGSIELGNVTTPNTPFIDFHSSGNNVDFDSRIIATGGTTSYGQGTLNFVTSPNGITGDFSAGNVQRSGATVLRPLAAQLSERLSVLDFGATGNGTTDDTAAIQAAINAAAAANGRVLFPPGTYKLTSTLNIGNGTTTAPSSISGVILEGLFPPPMSNLIGGNFDSQIGTSWRMAKLLWAGAANGNIVQINGPVQGWGLNNLFLDGNNIAGNGIAVISGMYGDSRNVVIQFCVNAGIYLITQPPMTGHGMLDSLFNTWTNIIIGVAYVHGAKGIYLGGGANSSGVMGGNTDYNNFENLTITLPGWAAGSTNRAFGLYLGACDSNTFNNVHIFNGDMTQTYPLAFDYIQNPDWPAGNIISNIDYGPQAGPAFGQLPPIFQAGTPSAQNRPNRILMVNEANNAVWPSSYPNLAGPGPVAVYTNKLFSQTAALAQAIYTVGAPNAGLFRINYYLNVTGGNAGGGNLTVAFFWQDGSGNGGFGSAAVPNGPGNYTNGSVICACGAFSNIGMQTFFNAFPGGTTTLYSLFVTIERLM